MVMAVVDAGSSSSSSSSYEVVICLEVVTTLFVVEILFILFLLRCYSFNSSYFRFHCCTLWKCEPSTLLFFNFTPGKVYFTVLKKFVTELNCDKNLIL